LLSPSLAVGVECPRDELAGLDASGAGDVEAARLEVLAHVDPERRRVRRDHGPGAASRLGWLTVLSPGRGQSSPMTEPKIEVISERTDSKIWYYVTLDGEKVSQHSFKWTATFKAWRLKASLPRFR
jgi:hypothetical protein